MSIQFSELNLHPSLLSSVAAMGYLSATPVQEKVMPHALAGNDLMVSSQTGSGKTAAFLLPILDSILNNKPEPVEAPRVSPKDRKGNRRTAPATPIAVVLCPTRELAQQVAKEAIRLKGNERGIRIATVVGGMPYGQQIRELANVTVLVATPGRLIDLYNQRALSFEQVKFFVADEADRMLDLGFADDLRSLHASCKHCEQTLMFSATFPKNIMKLAEEMMEHPVRIELAKSDTVNTDIHQVLNWADNLDHQDQLLMHWLRQEDLNQAVVFTSTQIESEKIAEVLEDEGFSVTYLHGGIPQKTRNRRLDALRKGSIKILVATDVAARGIDVATITHVINYGLPMKPEDYVHRIGRTGRAGRSGMAITIANLRDRRKLTAIVHYTSNPIDPSVVVGLEPKLDPSKFRDQAPKGKGRPRRGRSSGGPREGGFAKRRSGEASERREAPAKKRSEVSTQKFFGAKEERGAAPKRSDGKSRDPNRTFKKSVGGTDRVKRSDTRSPSPRRAAARD